MANEKQYSSTIKSKPLFYIETKRLAELVVQGLNEIELKEHVINQNIFQVNTESRKREIASTILNRFKVLDDFLIKKIYTSNVSTSKVIVLYAILKTDILFYEFMEEIYSEKLHYKGTTLDDRDFNEFFDSKRQQSDKIASWQDYTFYKLKQVYIRILYEVGLIKEQKSPREILTPLMDQDVLEHLHQLDGPKYIKTIVGD